MYFLSKLTNTHILHTMCCYLGNAIHCIRKGGECPLEDHRGIGRWLVPLEKTQGTDVMVPGNHNEAHRRQDLCERWDARAQSVALEGPQGYVPLACAP